MCLIMNSFAPSPPFVVSISPYVMQTLNMLLNSFCQLYWQKHFQALRVAAWHSFFPWLSLLISLHICTNIVFYADGVSKSTEQLLLKFVLVIDVLETKFAKSIACYSHRIVLWIILSKTILAFSFVNQCLYLKSLETKIWQKIKNMYFF